MSKNVSKTLVTSTKNHNFNSESKRSKICYVIFASIGDDNSAKGEESSYVINGLLDVGDLVKVISLYPSKSKVRCQTSWLITFIYKVMGFLSKKGVYVFRRYRMISEHLFDLYASKNIEGDILYVHTELPKTMAVGRKKGMKLIVNATTYPSESFNQLLAEESSLKDLKHKTLLPSRGKYTDVDLVIAYSDNVKQEYIKAGYLPERIKVVSPGVDTKSLNPSKKKHERFTVLMLSNHYILKGTSYLLEAWKGANLKDAQLILCGKQIPEVKETYNQLITNNVVITDYVNDVSKWYKKADLFVLPSLSEGSAKVIYEAMACGLPVICTPECGSIVRDGKDGFIVPSRDAVAIRKKLKYLYTHPKERLAMGRSARRRAEQYTWERYSNGIKKAVLEVCK